MREFDAQQLEHHLKNTDSCPLLLDVRQDWEYDICRLEDSLLIPMAQIPAEFNELDKDRETVVICHHGIRSRQVGYYLEQAGFTNVINLNGGLDAWARIIDKNMATY
ncbi:MAG: rhodanese-like domain-containing protein [Gammaproteobacteria bacterium]|nr:rhodanese-like domain-containing protein [Gammaproteobacteria bacterium]